MIICTFAIGDKEIYAMDAAELIEVTARPAEISESGVVCLRGDMMTIINPTAYMNVDTLKRTDFPLILVCALQGQEQKYAIQITEVFDVIEIDHNDIHPNPVSNTDGGSLIDGVIILDEKLVIMLNIQSLVQCCCESEHDIELF